LTDGGKMNPVIDADGHVFETNYVYSVADRMEPIWVQCFRRFILLSLPAEKKSGLMGEIHLDWCSEHNGSVFYMRSDTQYKSLADVRNAGEPPKCSTAALGTASHYVPKLIEETLKLRLNLVTGYPGGAEQDLAPERGEVQCRAVAIATFFGREPYFTWHKKGFVRLLLQTLR
jgi:hypothetical protein